MAGRCGTRVHLWRIYTEYEEQELLEAKMAPVHRLIEEVFCPSDFLFRNGPQYRSLGRIIYTSNFPRPTPSRRGMIFCMTQSQAIETARCVSPSMANPLSNSPHRRTWPAPFNQTPGRKFLDSTLRRHRGLHASLEASDAHKPAPFSVVELSP